MFAPYIACLRKFFAGKAKAPKVPPEALPADILAQVAKEADFLKAEHAVSVRSLNTGEIPTVPQKAAD